MKKQITNFTLIIMILVVSGIAQATIYTCEFDAAGPASSDFAYFSSPTKWDPGANTASYFSFSPPNGPGTPGGATFSIMDAGFSDVSGYDSGHSANVTQSITSLGISGYTAAHYASDISAALNIWASVSAFTNLGQVADGGVNAGASEASGGHLGDIRIAAWEITTSDIIISHAFQPGTETLYGAGGTIGGDMHFDIDRTWVNDELGNSGAGEYDFFTVALHELGHSLGLGHSDVSGSIMEEGYAGTRRTLHADDIAGIQAIYGVVPEPATLALLGFGSLMLRKRSR